LSIRNKISISNRIRTKKDRKRIAFQLYIYWLAPKSQAKSEVGVPPSQFGFQDPVPTAETPQTEPLTVLARQRVDGRGVSYLEDGTGG